jgi:hypothetical protein
LKEIVRVQDKSVIFTASFEGKEFTYHYEGPNSKLAKNLAEVLARNIGKTVKQLGAIEVNAQHSLATKIKDNRCYLERDFFQVSGGKSKLTRFR